jgi:crotonobetainyl-CoA:carnitine CoA-transferase CaiB-like acyl-CoA transferase
MERLPLSGIRVLDLTRVWAGPYGTRLLADMGAEVIKVEGPRSWDLIRALHLLPSATERPYNKSVYFNLYNRNKYGCTIDLAHPAGRDLALRLAAMSDVVIENYRSDVLQRLGLDYDTLRSVREDIVLVSMPSHGLAGPESHHTAYGTHIEQLSGLVAQSGYPDGPPQRSAISYGDPMAGSVAAAATIAALLYRRWTGRGQHVEVAQWEAFLPFVGEFFVEYDMTGRGPARRGNGHASMAPHGVYPCAGDDLWIAIAVGSDAEFAALCDAMGRPELARDERYADVVSRYRNRAELDTAVSDWTRTQDHNDAAARLQAAGVSAMPVLTIQELVTDPHLAARGFLEDVAHRDAGVWTMDGPAWRFDRTPAHVRLPAPCFGEHNDYVLSGLLGLSDEDIERLKAEGVVSDEPAAGQDE